MCIYVGLYGSEVIGIIIGKDKGLCCYCIDVWFGLDYDWVDGELVWLYCSFYLVGFGIMCDDGIGIDWVYWDRCFCYGSGFDCE